MVVAQRSILFKFLIPTVLLGAFGLFHMYFSRPNPRIKLNTIYGTYEITEPVLIDLINHPMVQRLKELNQYGNLCYISDHKDFTRYDHSIGVMVLLRKYGACLNEQIAGLLHDASHTVFSHVGDWLFNNVPGKDSYQDNIHEWALSKSGVADTLAKHGLSVKDINHKNPEFIMLEQGLPDICADRLEYIIHGGFCEGLITQEDINELLAGLSFEDGKWVFPHSECTRKFALASITVSDEVWGSQFSLYATVKTAKALEIAVDEGLLTLDDVHFGVDEPTWKLLTTCQSPRIRNIIEMITNQDKYVSAVSKEDSNFYIKRKFSGVDPLVNCLGGKKRLTELDENFAQHTQMKRTEILEGFHICEKEIEIPENIEEHEVALA